MPALSKLYTKKEIDSIRDALIETYGNNCAICGKSAASFKKKLAVDHEHKFGTIRGLLCYHDNRFVVGRFDIPKAFKLMQYLIKYDDKAKHRKLLEDLLALLTEELK